MKQYETSYKYCSERGLITIVETFYMSSDTEAIDYVRDLSHCLNKPIILREKRGLNYDYIITLGRVYKGY